jgi:hypothetical protein
MKSSKKEKKFIAVVEEAHVDKINDIADKMKQEGVNVDQVLSMTGIITGSAYNLDNLNNVEGIKSIEEDKEKHAW